MSAFGYPPPNDPGLHPQFPFVTLWSNIVTYPKGAWVTVSNGDPYFSLTDNNTGHDPTTDGGVNWQRWTSSGIPVAQKGAASGVGTLDATTHQTITEVPLSVPIETAHRNAPSLYYDPTPNAGGSPNISIGGILPSLQAGAYSNQAFGHGWRGALPQTGNLGQITTGFDNTAIGAGVMVSATTAHACVGIGADALSALTTGNSNIGIGAQAAETITTASSQIAIGNGALQSATTPAGPNIAIGSSAMSALTTGQRNIGIGHQALSSQLTNSDCTAVGYRAAVNIVNINNTAIGSGALAGGTAGNTNVANNTAIGANALTSTTTANANTALGNSAGANATTGGANTIIGASSGAAIVTGSNNVVVGSSANPAADGSNMTLVGWSAAGGSSGNTAIGMQATASGIGASAFGRGTTASGNGSVALGFDHSGVGASTAIQDQIALGTANHHILLATAAAPADASIAASTFTLWLDPTNGAAKLMIKAKQADGTVRTGNVALA